jgi:hypothetical protein
MNTGNVERDDKQREEVETGSPYFNVDAVITESEHVITGARNIHVGGRMSQGTVDNYIIP